MDNDASNTKRNQRHHKRWRIL